MLMRLKEQGRLGMFCLFYFRALPNLPDAEAVWRRRFMAVMTKRYNKAKELGILDKAYFYGCDEFNPPTFTNIQAAAKIMHKEFPGVPIMTTARDVKLGTGDSVLKDIDIHCPALCFWSRRPVAEAKKSGRKVWWYFCNSPSWPFANTMIEGSPAEIRSLMGAQTQKFKPDGFLYYATMKWNAMSPIMRGPFTQWDACSMRTYHGDGQWTCCGGPDLMPLATIRLENFRDGIEDLWYVRELEKRLALRKDKDDRWAKDAKAALAVPDEVAKTTADFSISPSVIYRWRDNIADLIEEAQNLNLRFHFTRYSRMPAEKPLRSFTARRIACALTGVGKSTAQKRSFSQGPATPASRQAASFAGRHCTFQDSGRRHLPLGVSSNQ